METNIAEVEAKRENPEYRYWADMAKTVIREGYAWPGGYPVYVVVDDGAMLCRDCARENLKSMLWETWHALNGGWRIIGTQIHFEGEEFCGHCSKQLEAAYT